jgi:enoyl-CoA hydratase/carnithine racemase
LQAIEETLAAGDDVGWPATERATDRIRVSEDMHEGVRAFLERREPNWLGR